MLDDLEKQKLELKIAEAELDTKDFLFSFSQRKRTILLVLVIAIIPMFFITKYAVSKIYEMNYRKNMADLHQATFTAQAISIIETRAVPISDKNYSAYALIKNRNTDLVSPNIQYSFEFYGSSGNLLGRERGSTFILAGQQKYLIVPNIRLSETPTRVRLDISNQDWKKRIELPNVIISKGIPKTQDVQSPSAGYTIEGTFQNNSTYTLNTVIINGVVFDKSGNVIAVTQYSAHTLVPNEQRNYKMFWPVPLSSIVGRVEIFPETNILDNANFQ